MKLNVENFSEAIERQNDATRRSEERIQVLKTKQAKLELRLTEVMGKLVTGKVTICYYIYVWGRFN